MYGIIVTISNVSKMPKAVIKPNLLVGITSLNKNVINHY